MVGINCSQDILGGKPIIAGTRISVDLVSGYVLSGDIQKIFSDYPYLEKKQVERALGYINKKASQAERDLVASRAQA